MRRRIRATVLMLALALATVLALGSAPRAPTAPAKKPTTPLARVLSQVKGLSGKRRETKLYALARQEGGTLELYTSMTSDVIKKVEEQFEATFGGIDVKVYRAGSETVLQKLLEEQAARFRGADIVETNGTELATLQQRKALLAYQPPYRKNLQPGSTFKAWTATRFNKFVISWNTNLVRRGEQPKRWEDLANPKWAKKLAMEASDVDWYMALWTYWVKVKKKKPQQANALFAAMARNSSLVSGHTTMASLLAAGQFSVAASNYSYLVKNLQEKGAPVSFTPVVQPVFVRANGVALVARGAHPATAVLFTDWMLTRAQPLLRENNLDPARRDLIDPLLSHVKAVRINLDQYIAEVAKWTARYEQVVALAQKG